MSSQSAQSAQPPVRYVPLSRGHARYHLHGSNLAGTRKHAGLEQGDRSDLIYLLFRQVSELVGSVCLGVADLLTDALAYARLGEIAVPSDAYHAAYAVILCFGVVTTVLSLGYRLRNARLMRAYVLELGKQDHKASVSAARKQAQQHEWELAQTHRSATIASLALLSIVAQGACDARGSLRVLSVQREINTAAFA